ncbi:heavy metal translocating P-type ATPase [Limosilactobacillus agrestimuris]|uniref:heavy metal translocating P-type ATPase n=1 Tax=Limosilactobacillus agrestimuris TaxID=2941331 RepID=UPI0020412FCD|nr:heavy metal translocating P-type ATPase [Limosilactobacillus agrestimuris]
MVKIQRFFTDYRKEIVIVTTGLLILAEFFHFIIIMSLPYQVIMAIVGVIGLVPIFLTAVSSLQVKLVSIDVLVSIAVIGAFIIGEFNEAAIVTWLFMLGEVLENVTLQKTRSAVQQLTKLAPQTAIVINEDGDTEEEDIDFIEPGTHVLVKTGAKVPVDGQILTGSALLNEASVTGEAKLVNKQIGMTIFAGTIVENGTIIVRTTAAGEDTTFGKIIELVEEAQDSQTTTQRFIDRFSQYYTPFVLLASIIVGMLTWDVRLAITVMVLGCPGALVIGVPASTVAGIGNGAKHGILFKGSNVMDQLQKVDTMIFDKTGTLTEGQPQVATIKILKGSRQSIINKLVAIEQQSDHPLAKAIKQLPITEKAAVSHVQAIKGHGLQAMIDGHKYLLGNLTLVNDLVGNNNSLKGTVKQLSNEGNSIVIIVNDTQTELAVFGIKDQLRSDSANALHQLKMLGVQHLIMLTGDNQETANQIACTLPLSKVKAQMLPQDKAVFVKKMQKQGHQVAFVGDGINDSPALAQANVAVAMGSGTDVAMDVADLVLVTSNLTSLVNGLKLAKRTINNMNENILIALVTVVLLFIGLFVGYIEMASGMLIHELSILVVILNSMRLMR